MQYALLAYAPPEDTDRATRPIPGHSPSPGYERSWTNRFHLMDLDEAGRRGLGLG